MDPPLLKPGDVLLYNAPSLVDWVIDTKTGSDVAHVEVYFGEGQSLASRNGIGVNAYALRTDGLVYVRRPKTFFDQTTAGQWFETVRGEGYNFLGLLQFDNIPLNQPNHLFCSAFATLLLRSAGVEVFAPDFPAGKVSPRDFKLSPVLYGVKV